MSETEVRVVLADGTVVGPDEVLVVHVAAEDWPSELAEELLKHFKAIGLEDRVLIITGGEIEFVKVAKE